MRSFIIISIFLIIQVGCNPRKIGYEDGPILRLSHDRNAGTISVFREDGQHLLTQNSKPTIRPYIHPIMAPDGNGVLTEYSPEHHKHQTGLYWGLKQVNGRDYFMNWQGDYCHRISATVIEAKGQRVRWQAVYDLLDEKTNTILTETQNWSMHEEDGKFLLDLEWRGKAQIDITMGKFYVGGLFLRMPWHEGITGDIINASGNRNNEAEGQRAIWNDIGIQIEGREDFAHIAILDHPDNSGFPIPWRVDNELGIGPSRQILGDWSIRKGETEFIRYRLIVYTGDLNNSAITDSWKEYICEP
ncbi:MAG: PmoA family protein [Bacteroidetes bacterium]|nr:PmoA family protein [Bacteroidota bacterium]MDA1120127.1 PmoA family protein [Bacteroidota bacterium]